MMKLAQDDNKFTPAPLDKKDLDRSLAPLGEAVMLPAAAYTDPQVLAWERTNIFDSGWVMAAHGSSLTNVGDQVGVALGNESVVVSLSQDDSYCALANVCRHRGHELLAVGEKACRPALRCPYHGWVYDLDGRLRHATGGDDLNKEEFSLIPRRVDTKWGWIFVNANGQAAPLSDALAGLDEVLAPYGIENLVSIAHHEYEVAANWKVVHENYQECLHCPRIHPELSRVSPPDSGDNIAPGPTWVGGWMDLAPTAATMSMDGQAIAPCFPGLSAASQRRVAYFALFPNLLVSAHPDYVLTHRLEPLATNRTRIVCEWLVAPESAADPNFDPTGAIEIWDRTNQQDWRACESVQRGLESPAYVPGPLLDREDAVARVVEWFARTYSGRSPVESRAK